jgi:SAM-dependent methyltransferase
MSAIENGSASSAAVIVPLVIAALGGTVRSVVDVGCGPGAWTTEFSRYVERAIGIDGSYAIGTTRLDREHFIASDLGSSFNLAERFDLAVSLEVAEHLPISRAEGFVCDLVRLSDAVLFGAAVPGQPGEHHINCEWQSYWASLFASHGYNPVDCIRPAVWGNPNVMWWYQQNTLLYLKDADSHLVLPLDIVHPDLMAAQRSEEPTLRVLAREAPGAIRRSVRHHIRRIIRRTRQGGDGGFRGFRDSGV